MAAVIDDTLLAQRTVTRVAAEAHVVRLRATVEFKYNAVTKDAWFRFPAQDGTTQYAKLHYRPDGLVDFTIHSSCRCTR